MKEPIILSTDNQWARGAAGKLKIPVQIYVDALGRGERICGACKQSLPLTSDYFHKDSHNIYGFRTKCRSCLAISKHDYYYRTHPRDNAVPRIYKKKENLKFDLQNSTWQKEYRRFIRSEAIKAYGGKCACCGETEPVFLDLDHIHGDGAKHRRESKISTISLMAQLRADGWPTDRFQILCSNCNQGKSRNGGICPHQHKVRLLA